MQKNLSVIIPVYNEEKTIRKVLDRVLKQKETYEVIIVDDGSKDNSVAVIKDYITNHSFKKIQVFAHKRNQGKGQAIITGIKEAKGDFIIIQDADLEYNPADYPRLLKPLMDNQADFVLGNRWDASRRGYLLAQLGNLYMTWLTNILYFKLYNDTYTGYKVGHRKVWTKLNLKSKQFEIEAEITAKLAKFKYKTKDVPIRYNPRTFKQGKKINWRDVVKGSVVLLKLRL